LTAAETLAAPLTTLTSTLIAVRNFTSGTQLYTTVTGYNTRLTALENLSGTPSSTLYTTLTSHTSTLTDVGTRLTAAENLNGVTTTLTTVVKAVRDLTAGYTITDALIGMRDLTVTTTPIASTLLAIRDFSPTVYVGYTTLNGLKSLTAGTTLTDAVIGMRDMSVTGSALVTSINNMKNLVSGSSPLVTRVLGMRNAYYQSLMGHAVGPSTNWATSFVSKGGRTMILYSGTGFCTTSANTAFYIVVQGKTHKQQT
jgi:hypothetical protein